MRPMIAHAREGVVTHGMEAGLTAPDWPQLVPGELEELARQVPAMQGPIRLLWHSPRPFSAAARVQTACGELFVKRHYAGVRDVASLLEEHRFLDHLRARAIPVPMVIADGANCTAVAMDRWTYEVHALAPGVDAYRDAHSWTPVRSFGHARALGRALAQMHLAAVGFNAPARSPRPLMASFDIVGAEVLADALEGFVAQRPAVVRFLGAFNWRDEILGALGPLHEALRPLLPELDALWVHNDWHASNLFWSDAGVDAQVRAIIDFGLCNRGLAVVDLATALERNTVAWLDLDGDPREAGGAIGRVPLAQAVLDGYCAVRALRPAERQALPLLMPLAHVEYALSEVDYFHGVLANAHNARLAYPNFLLGHVRWFGGRHGRDYLAGLRGWLRSGRA